MNLNVMVFLVFISLVSAAVVGMVIYAVSWIVEKKLTREEAERLKKLQEEQEVEIPMLTKEEAERLKKLQEEQEVEIPMPTDESSLFLVPLYDKKGEKRLFWVTQEEFDSYENKLPEATNAILTRDKNRKDYWEVGKCYGEDDKKKLDGFLNLKHVIVTKDEVDTDKWYNVFYGDEAGSIYPTPSDVNYVLEKLNRKITVAYYATIEDDRYASGKPCFSVTFPDLDDCCTWGDTLSEALQNARGVLKDYLIHSEPEFIKPPSTASELVKQGHSGWITRIEVELIKIA